MAGPRPGPCRTAALAWLGLLIGFFDDTARWRRATARFSIVAALVNDPDVVFLDEPTTGLDPQARHNLWDVIRRINTDEGTTIILTTHHMQKAEVLSDRVAIVDHGRLIALDTPMGLITDLPAPVHAGAGPASLEDVFLARTGTALRD